LHFNLTEGHALSGDRREFLGKEGFWAASRQAQGGSPQLLDRDWIRQELMAQLDKFRELTGHEPQYVDGHNHIHVSPVVAAVLLEVLPPRGIRFVRCPIEVLEPAAQIAPSDAAASAAADKLAITLPPTQRAFFEEIMTHARVRASTSHSYEQL
jgi:predicted glycoside hydrolase/deacetylase ChbG (UPF0249 family)